MKYYIKTFGCQMNVYDSQRIARILQNMGHTPAASPAEADLIIFNTCHIREKAAEKLFSDLGRINLIKEERKAAGLETIIGVVGCVVQAEDGEIARRAPFVNFATGPLTYYRIPEILQKSPATRTSASSTPSLPPKANSTICRKTVPKAPAPILPSRKAATTSAPTASFPIPAGWKLRGRWKTC